MSNVLILAPHADDEILGCGGTIAKHVSNGDTVYVAVLTNASVGASELFSKDDIKIVREECTAANRVLGVEKVFFENLPAPQLEQYPQYKISNIISELLKKTSPTHLYIPHKGDLHMDHGAIYNAALIAARPVPGQSVRHIFAYETLSETEWGHPTPEMTFVPTKFVDIGNLHLNAKIKAMECYSSQVKQFPESRSIESIRALAMYRGSSIGVKAAESFVVVRTIN